MNNDTPVDIDLDTFITVRSRTGASKSNSGQNLIINSNSISIEALGLEHAGMKAGAKTMHVVYQYSPGPPPLIRLLPPEKAESRLDVYVLTKTKASNNLRYIAGLPSHLKELQPPRGNYRPLPDHPGIFVYDEESKGAATLRSPARTTLKQAYYDERPENIEVGDVVSWYLGSSYINRHPDIATVIATGVVKDITHKEKGNISLLVHPISKNWMSKSKQVTIRNAHRAIIRRKHNA